MRQPRRTFSARRMFGAASLLAITAAAPAMAEQEAQNFEIPSQPLSEAIAEFARQANLDVIAPSALTRGKTSKPVTGEMEPQKALQLLMSDAALDVRRNDGGTLILVQAVTDVPKPQTSPTADPAPLPATPRDPAEMADSQPTRATPLQRADRADDEERTLGRVTVTGTSLRGFAPESSPLQVYSREDILGSGMTTTEEFIRSLPQNFGGGSTDGTPGGLPGDINSQFNNTFGTGPNLRGLGAGATLTLLNGRRLAPTSEIGDFIDLSMIPVSALERIDVLTDGASSIYGGDAVAGVMNFVVRDDFEGAETALRYGTVTSGDMSEYRLSQTLGTNWGSGNILATYEYHDRDNLTLADRPQIGRPVVPTNQLPIDPALFDLAPQQTRHSAILAANQEIGSALTVSATALYSKREADRSTVTNSAVLRSTSESELIAGSIGADIEMSPRWTLALDATYSQIRNDGFSRAIAPVPSAGSQKLTRSDLSSADIVINGEAFDLAAGPVALAVGGHIRREEFKNERVNFAVDRQAARDVSAVYAEALVPLVGPTNERAGIKRLEINASGRVDNYSDFGTTTNPKIGVLWSPVDDLNLRGSYSSSFNPPPLGRTGDLLRTAQVVPFSFLMNALNIPAPSEGLADADVLVASGTAADLDPETSRTYTFGVDHSKSNGPHSWRVRSTYYDIDFEGRLGATPIPENQLPVLAPWIVAQNPNALPQGTVLFSPTADDIAALVSTLGRPVVFSGGATNLNNIGAINFAPVVRNLSSTKTSGIDLDATYSVQTTVGMFRAGFNANYIINFEQQASATVSPVETLNTYLNPVDLQLRGRFGYSDGGFSTNLALNYVDSYRTDSTESTQKISSWTTFDLTMAYSFLDERHPVLSGSSINLAVRNIFDRPPPATPADGMVRLGGFDPTNASPIMRYVAIELRKTF